MEYVNIYVHALTCAYTQYACLKHTCTITYNASLIIQHFYPLQVDNIAELATHRLGTKVYL